MGSDSSGRRGCAAGGARNYDMAATLPDLDLCIFDRVGCAVASALNYDSLATVNAGCVLSTRGCADSNALNYASDVNIADDASCRYGFAAGSLV